MRLNTHQKDQAYQKGYTTQEEEIKQDDNEQKDHMDLIKLYKKHKRMSRKSDGNVKNSTS